MSKFRLQLKEPELGHSTSGINRILPKGGLTYVEVEPALCLRMHLMSSQIIKFQPLFALCVTIELAPLPHALSPLYQN